VSKLLPYPAIGLAVLLCAWLLSAEATIARDRKQRSLFMQSHPCPANGHIRGKCPGYVIGHTTPLCAGGADRWSNMQWQTIEEAKIKDREERTLCAQQKRK
jgi:hypothetical protein